MTHTQRSIEEIMASIETDREQAAEGAEEERLVLCAAMITAGVVSVEIKFAGYGDSGQIEEIEVVMADGHVEPDDLNKKLEDWVYSFLDGTGVDWYNNDGGQGTISFGLTNAVPHFHALVEYNEMVAHTGFEVEEGV